MWSTQNISSSTPAHLSSSATPGTSFYPLTQFLSCAKFSPSHRHFLAAISAGTKSISYFTTAFVLEWRSTM